MRRSIQAKEGSQLGATASDDTQGKADAAMEFVTAEAAAILVRRLTATAKGREQLRRILAEIDQQTDDNDWMPRGIF